MATQGIPVPVICDSLNIVPRTYFRWRAEAPKDWPSRAIPSLPPETKAQVFKLLDGGMAVAEVTRQTGVSRKTITRWRRLRPIHRWRCVACTPFGVLVDSVSCPKCGTVAPWGQETSS
jgi:hypothetical protein